MAANVLCCISQTNGMEDLLASANCMEPLVNLLTNSKATLAARKSATVVLANLCDEEDRASQVQAAGAVPALLSIISLPQNDAEFQVDTVSLYLWQVQEYQRLALLTYSSASLK